MSCYSQLSDGAFKQQRARQGGDCQREERIRRFLKFDFGGAKGSD